MVPCCWISVVEGSKLSICEELAARSGAINRSKSTAIVIVPSMTCGNSGGSCSGAAVGARAAAAFAAVCFCFCLLLVLLMLVLVVLMLLLMVALVVAVVTRPAVFAWFVIVVLMAVGCAEVLGSPGAEHPFNDLVVGFQHMRNGGERL